MRPFNIIEKRQKEVRKLNKEFYKLWDAKRNLGYIELEKPIRHGWFKHLTLRDDIARRKDATVFREILEASGIDVWGLDKKHADKFWDKQSRKDNTIQYPGLRKLSKEKYNKLSKQAQKWYEGFDWYWDSRMGNVKRYYCRVPRYFYKITYTKAFITKKQVVDPKIEKRMSEIKSILRSNEYYFLDISNYHYGREFNPMYNRILRRRTKTALVDYEEEAFDRLIYDRIQW